MNANTRLFSGDDRVAQAGVVCDGSSIANSSRTHILLCIESHISPVLMPAIDSFTLFIVIYLFIREDGQGPANKPEGSTFLLSRAARPAGRRRRVAVPGLSRG